MKGKRDRKLSTVVRHAAKACDDVAGWLASGESFNPMVLAEAMADAARDLRDFDKWDKKALKLIDRALKELREEKAALLEACKAVMEGDAFDEHYRDLCAEAIRKAEKDSPAKQPS